MVIQDLDFLHLLAHPSSTLAFMFPSLSASNYERERAWMIFMACFYGSGLEVACIFSADNIGTDISHMVILNFQGG